MAYRQRCKTWNMCHAFPVRIYVVVSKLGDPTIDSQKIIVLITGNLYIILGNLR